jgi:hypothetical protein
MLPAIPDRLLRSRWLALTDDYCYLTYTSIPTSLGATFFSDISGAVE